MDHDDARFIADALDSRISGDRDTLDRLASSSFIRLATSAARVKALAAGWPPAIIAADVLETIAKYGAAAADEPASSNLIIFVDKMRSILATPGERAVPRNRAERRRKASKNRRLLELRPGGPLAAAS